MDGSKKEPLMRPCFICFQNNCSEYNERENHSVSATDFLMFAEHHLEIPIKELDCDIENSFCKTCHDFVALTCELYDELCGIQRKLNKRLEQLAELLENSPEDSSHAGKLAGTGMCTGLSQSEDDDDAFRPVPYENMRKLLADKCKLHCRRVSAPPTLPGENNSCENANITPDVDEDLLERVKVEAEGGDSCDDEEGSEGGQINEDTGSDYSPKSPNDEDIDCESERMDSDDDPDWKEQDAPHDDGDTIGTRGSKAKTKRIPAPECSRRDKPYKCSICSKSYPSVHNRLRHMKTIHGIDQSTPKKVYPNKCTHCPKTFKQLFNLERHLYRKHGQKMSFKCPQCPSEFDTRRLLTHHLYQVHKSDKKSSSFLRRVQAASDTGASSNAISESCVVCGEEFTSWDLLGKHLRQHEKKVKLVDKTRKCYFCSEMFAHEQSIWAHLRSSQSHNFTKVQFPCDHPDHMGFDRWAYPSPELLQEHLEQDHGSDPVSKCSDCEWPFLNKSMLDVHRLLHLPKVNMKLGCPVCEKTFLNGDTLQDHFNTTHGENLKRYRCSVCSWAFSTMIGCTNHAKIHKKTMDNAKGQHEGSDKFPCPDCSKSYPTAMQLKSHRRGIHVSKQCAECGVMVQVSKLGNHMRRVHDKDKGQHLCTECGKGYSTPIELKQHMSSHGQYPFTCQFCGKGSRNGYHLRRHIGRMHKDRVADLQLGKQLTGK